MRRWRSSSPSPRWCGRSAAGSTTRGAISTPRSLLQSQFVDLAPAAEAEVALMLARAALRLGDVKPGAPVAPRARLLRRLPEAVTLHRWDGRRGGTADAVSPPAPARRAADDGGGAAHPPVPAHPSHVPRDRRADLRSGNTVKTQATASIASSGSRAVPTRSCARATAACWSLTLTLVTGASRQPARGSRGPPRRR